MTTELSKYLGEPGDNYINWLHLTWQYPLLWIIEHPLNTVLLFFVAFLFYKAGINRKSHVSKNI